MKSQKIKIPIYGGTLTMILVKELSEVQKKYKTASLDDYGAVVFKEDKKYRSYIVAFGYDFHGGLISHEVTHIKNHIYIDTGTDLDRFNDEPEAYLVGWLFEQIEIFLNKNK